MNTIILVTSHLGANYDALVGALNQNPRIHIRNTRSTYECIGDVEHLISLGHKQRNLISVYGDLLLYNYQFSCKSLMKFCKFIYLIRDARSSLNYILANMSTHYSPLTAWRYYAYRLRRMCEMAKKTPGAVVLTWRDLAENKFDTLVYDYLGTNGMPLKAKIAEESLADSVPYEILHKAEDCYERHLYYLKSLQIRRTF
jgi:hypothetical protein